MNPSATLSSPIRLRICAYLSGCEEADFSAVQGYCELSQPNLSKHLTALHEEGLVEILKVAAGRYTKTRVRLTEAGRRDLAEHVAWLREIAANAESAGNTTDAEPRPH